LTAAAVFLTEGALVVLTAGADDFFAGDFLAGLSETFVARDCLTGASAAFLEALALVFGLSVIYDDVSIYL
jgi:hypothetical protein